MYERFEILLKENNVTAYEVSKATNIARATLTNWKKGKYTPKIDKIQKIADYFHVSAEWLLGRDVPKEQYELNIDLNTTELKCDVQTIKDEKHIVPYLDSCITFLDDKETIMVDQKSLTPQKKESLKQILQDCKKQILNLYKDL